LVPNASRLEFTMTFFRMLPDKRRLSWTLALSLAAATAQAAGMVDLLNLTFDSNPSLQSQASLVRASQAEVKGANWQFYPTPSVSVEQVSASNQDTSYNKDSRVITFRLQQPLWTAGRLTAGVGRAEAASAVAMAQMEETRLQLALRTIQAWGEWRAGHQKLIAQRESLQTHQRLVALIQRRVEGGVSAVADEVMAQGRLEQTQSELALAQAQQVSAARAADRPAHRRRPARRPGHRCDRADRADRVTAGARLAQQPDRAQA
jgi:adhesin transport system outer membrane protein